MSSKGMTLLEVLVAMAIVGIAMTSIAPAFVTCLDTNTRNEVRSGAVAAAQSVMEGLRRQDPATLPMSGVSSPQQVSVGNRNYEVVASFCVVADFCGSGSRHVIVEVNLNGRLFYSAESVFTQLR